MILLAPFMELVMRMKMLKSFVSSSECYLIISLFWRADGKIYIHK